MIYFIKDTVSLAIKIGYSKTPKKRLGALQTANASKLMLLGTISGTESDEVSYHSRFAQYRLQGEWFRGEIIEEVLEIIASHKKLRLEMRRKTVTETTTTQPNGQSEVAADSNKNGATDKETGILGVCLIPGLRMKSLSVKLTERKPEEKHDRRLLCGIEVKYVLVFEKRFSEDVPEGREQSELQRLRTAFQITGPYNNTPATLIHRFYDEDNVMIPYYPDNQHHLVGGHQGNGQRRRCFQGLDRLRTRP